MKSPFSGSATPMSADDLATVLDILQTGAAELWSLLTVETAGCGFDASGRPRILFERHLFSRATQGEFDATHPDISNPQPGGYGNADDQYARLNSAIALNRAAALTSTSWGIGQILGLNAAQAGFQDVEEMVAAMMASEGRQLYAIAKFLKNGKLDTPLRQRDWAAFAFGYNGPNYAINHYDERLAVAYRNFTVNPMPDLCVRATQILLTYLGYQPGSVDGYAGKATNSALDAFCSDTKYAPPQIDDALLRELTSRVQAMT